VPDPNANPVLRNFVERAKKENVPSHVIEKAIQKAAGTGGENYQPARYEGFGPGGSKSRSRWIRMSFATVFSAHGSPRASHAAVIRGLP
jgi:hypothetical protein